MTVEELLNKKKIDFRASGRDYVVPCFNPEHDDSNPSMRIDSVLGIFHCLSCGYKGNLFAFYDEKFDKLSRQREVLRRKIDSVRASSLGLKFPKNIQFLDVSYRVSKETIKEFEAFKSPDKDFVERIWFPVRDVKGRINCFIGRAEDKFAKPKYKFYPNNAVIPLFPLQLVQPIDRRVLLVEGIFDMLNLYQHGLKNAVTGFGIKTIKKDKLQLLKILGVEGIDVCFDPDEPGQDAAEHVKELIEDAGFDCRNVNLRVCDPGDLQKESILKLKEKLYGKSEQFQTHDNPA